MSNASSSPEEADSRPVKSKLPRVPWNPWLGAVFVLATYYLSQLTAGLFVSVYPLAQHWSQAEAQSWLESSVYAQFAFILMAEAIMIGSLLWFLKHYRCSFKTIGLVKPRWRDLAYGLAAAPLYYLVYLVVVAIVSHAVPGLDLDQEQQIGFNDVQGAIELTVTFISLVILPALVEELMVRGFLYSSLKKAMRILPAALLTSLIFAVAHLPEGGAAGPLYIAAIDTFILSLVLIYLREKTGSLWAPITLHALKNSVAFVALFILHVH